MTSNEAVLDNDLEEYWQQKRLHDSLALVYPISFILQYLLLNIELPSSAKYLQYLLINLHIYRQNGGIASITIFGVQPG